MNVSKRTGRLAMVTLMTACLIVSSYIVIPVPFALSGMSLQTLVVNLIGLLLAPIPALLTIVIYTLLCAVGVPVGNAGMGGVGYLLGPTGGFFLGFMIAVLVISRIRGKSYHRIRYMVVTIGIGIPIIYVFALGWMIVVTGLSLKVAFMTGCFPFLVPDIVKCIVASWMAKPLQKVMREK